MSTRKRTRFATIIGGTLCVAAALTMASSAASPRFYGDDPVWREADTQDASAMKPLDVDLLADLATNLLGPRTAVADRAKNVNTVDEVPDSSWYTNRAGTQPLTPADVFRGPDTTPGPEPGVWTVTSSKSDGVTAGFTIKDAKGQLWFLKFDPPGFRGMATGTEVAVTKLMWALGYHVPENHIAYMRREQLVLGNSAKFTPPGGKRRAMRLEDLDTLLQRTDREPDGAYRIVASKALPGTPIGRIRFFDTRPDDPNDIVPHEDRRELRGYGVFAAWLNHVDAKAINSLDTLITENGRSYVRHHLLDFGSALGSAGVGPADYWEGDEYLLEPRDTLKRMLSFGFAIPKWHTAPFHEAPSIGRFPADNASFNPDLWKPRVPNQAFLHARADDKFWAAQKLMSLTTDLLRAAIKAGDFRDPASEGFLVRALAERRDAIGRAYLTAVNPIADPSLDDAGVLTFRNASVDADFAKAPAGYRAVWFRFDNVTARTVRIAETQARSTRLEAPSGLPCHDGGFVKIELSSIDGSRPSWAQPINVFFRYQQGQWQLVGLERMPS
ncbi:MAG TPA: hypothetical protein VK504_04395 [Vicinamibacterales bacterium]|jgi:hypothetical protein|nr:hypothetical protein [Vicinamibacterales bacterium]